MKAIHFAVNKETQVQGVLSNLLELGQPAKMSYFSALFKLW